MHILLLSSRQCFPCLKSENNLIPLNTQLMLTKYETAYIPDKYPAGNSGYLAQSNVALVPGSIDTTIFFGHL